MMNIEKQTQKELDTVLARAVEKGNVTKDGIWVMNELQLLGWKPLAYIVGKHSKLFYKCGYSGCYNFSSMSKPI